MYSPEIFRLPLKSDDSPTSFLPVAISIKDLIQKVLLLKPNIPVPSESWIALQFQPKNRSAKSALNYTGKFDIVYKIQSRT